MLGQWVPNTSQWDTKETWKTQNLPQLTSVTLRPASTVIIEKISFCLFVFQLYLWHFFDHFSDVLGHIFVNILNENIQILLSPNIMLAVWLDEWDNSNWERHILQQGSNDSLEQICLCLCPNITSVQKVITSQFAHQLPINCLRSVYSII